MIRTILAGISFQFFLPAIEVRTAEYIIFILGWRHSRTKGRRDKDSPEENTRGFNPKSILEGDILNHLIINKRF